MLIARIDCQAIIEKSNSHSIKGIPVLRNMTNNIIGTSIPYKPISLEILQSNSKISKPIRIPPIINPVKAIPANI